MSYRNSPLLDSIYTPEIFYKFSEGIENGAFNYQKAVYNNYVYKNSVVLHLGIDSHISNLITFYSFIGDYANALYYADNFDTSNKLILDSKNVQITAHIL